jgi:hypothetical protein
MHTSEKQEKSSNRNFWVATTTNVPLGNESRPPNNWEKKHTKPFSRRSFLTWLFVWIPRLQALIPDSSNTADQILPCPVIIVECTPLEASKNDEAAKRGHICWNQLQLFVLEEKRKAANEE